MVNRLRHPTEKSLGWLLIQAARAHRNRLGSRLAALQLVAGQEQVLKAIERAGTMTMGELAAMLRVRPPTASKTVSRLSNLGLIQRLDEEQEDGRVIRVTLTDAGLAKARQVDALWSEIETQLIAGLDAKDQRRLRKLLRRITQNATALVE